MKTITQTDYQREKLQLLRDRCELQAVLIQKTEAVRLQRYNEATELRAQQREIQERLKLQLEKLKTEYEKLEFLPENLLPLDFIDHLLCEFQSSDPKLIEKLQTLHQFLQAQRIKAINHDEKNRAQQISSEILLVEEAIKEYKWLKDDATMTNLRIVAH